MSNNKKLGNPMRQSPCPANSLKILLVDGTGDDRAAFRQTLESACLGCEITDCAHKADAESILADGLDGFDLLVVGRDLGDGNGLEFCIEKKNSLPTLPIVMLADHVSQDDAVEALRAGISRYIVKDRAGTYLDLLPVLLPEVVDSHREQRALTESRKQLLESEARLRQIVNGSSVATFVIDEKHIVTHWNRACEMVTGTSAGDIIGTRNQWRAFYPEQRPVLADLVLDGANEGEIEHLYRDKFRRSELIEGAYEAEDYFPGFGDGGRWLYFTAAPVHDSAGRAIGAIETLQDFTERRRAEAALKESEERYRMLSITDSRTDLFNSRHLYERLDAEIARSARYASSLALMMLDVDDFKRFNDTYGHLAGDGVLRSLADMIRACLRRSDSAFRFGGEEFVVLLPETELEQAGVVAERVRARFERLSHAPIPGTQVRSSVSIGITCRREYETGSDCIRRADQAMYAAKQKGKNCVVAAA